MKKRRRWGQLFYILKMCAKFYKNRLNSFCRRVYTDFENLVSRKTRLKLFFKIL